MLVMILIVISNTVESIQVNIGKQKFRLLTFLLKMIEMHLGKTRTCSLHNKQETDLNQRSLEVKCWIHFNLYIFVWTKIGT